MRVIRNTEQVLRMVCCLGDEIVEVNGESFENMTHREAVDAIKKHKKGAVCLRILVARQITTKSQKRFHSYNFTQNWFEKNTFLSF